MLHSVRGVMLGSLTYGAKENLKCEELIFQQARDRRVDKIEESNSVGEGYIGHYSDRNIELWHFY